MYFRTKIDSETGKRLQRIVERIDECFEAQKAIGRQLGFENWRSRNMCIAGGFYSVIFPTEPDTKIWKEVLNGEYMPKLNTKEGKRIKAILDDCPTVHNQDLTRALGHLHAELGRAGFNFTREDYFGFETPESWNYTPPSDCEEMTKTAWHEMFKPKK